jgi:hypothetical protein
LALGTLYPEDEPDITVKQHSGSIDVETARHAK